MNWTEIHRQAVSKLTNQIGLDYGFADSIAWLFILLWYYGNDPTVISGYRSSERQDVLRARWEAGDREGIAYPPAAKSKHSATRLGRPAAKAIDFTTKDGNKLAGELISRYFPSLEWGGNYRRPDPNHVETAK